ncbi:hypothetical protein [Jannaschia aquimarina]|uniref:AAA+ family ATPase n=1 Tax=Jannaschia aquimarina TaxID=935700 RepID=A0A0D1D6B2_9RHOB|nr:hypothetical protein [Jannaschia aquimarina]KIT15533.1 hypothetical protein jaqu_27810 [Jannaschia aquimarina]SNT34647.1 hypothetical protein SAMN05421775_11262 [Jannaschia aquimarina]
MRHVILILALSLSGPAVAQGTDAPSADEPPTMVERGLRMFMEGLLQEMEPALDDMEQSLREAQPLLEELRDEMARALEGFDETIGAYHPPEMLPNGDIIIRRKEPLADGVEPNPDGSIDL